MSIKLFLAKIRHGILYASVALSLAPLSVAHALRGTDMAEGRAGLGETMKLMLDELGTGGSAAIQIGAGLIGFGMVAYSIYGLTMGRKKDEREYPLGMTLAIGIGGAVLLGLTAYSGILGTTFFGEDEGLMFEQLEGL